MKSPSDSRTITIARDLLGLKPPMYMVIIRSRSILFARSVGKDFQVLHHTAGESLSWKELCTCFFKQLQSHRLYYGQPFSVLIDSNHAYTHVQETSGLQPSQLRDLLQRFRQERTILNFATKELTGTTLVTVQGIDKESLNILTKELESRCLPVVLITTLSAYLTCNAMSVLDQKPHVSVIWWTRSDYSYVGTSPDSSRFNGTGFRADDEPNESIVERIRSTFFTQSDSVSVSQYFVDSSEQKHGFPIGDLFRRGHAFSGPQKSLCKGTSATRVARVLSTSLNSIKLLLLVLTTLTVIAGSMAVLVGSSSKADPETLMHYQDRYARKFTLQRELDSLKQVESTAVRKHAGVTNAAAVVSLFCQNSYAGLSLNSIAVKSSTADTIVIEASGIARSEAVIFRCNQDLNSLSAPYTATISSFRPETVSLNGVTDTVLNFKLGMVIHEKRSDK